MRRYILPWVNKFGDEINRENSIKILKAEKNRLELVVKQLNQMIIAGENAKVVNIETGQCGSGFNVSIDGVEYDVRTAIPWSNEEGKAGCQNLTKFLPEEYQN